VAILLDVVKSFPSGWPAAGDVVMLRPERRRRVVVARYIGDPEAEAEVTRHASRLSCRESDCPRCPIRQVCPSPVRQMRLHR
jgi:hypothetical protein